VAEVGGHITGKLTYRYGIQIRIKEFNGNLYYL
jgi:hypothetical protein